MANDLAKAIFGGCGPVGVTLGNVCSAVLSQLLWWPVCFWVLAVVCAASGLLTCLVVPADDPKSDHGEGQSKLSERFDLKGT